MVCRFFAGDCCQEKENRGFYVILEDISDYYQMPDLDKGLSNRVIQSISKFLGIQYLSPQDHFEACHVNHKSLRGNLTYFFKTELQLKGVYNIKIFESEII